MSMSLSLQVTSSWPGFSGIRHLVIFGDSYSSVGQEPTEYFIPPTRTEPLGLPFPGVGYAEPDEPNWVGHFITKYAPRIRYDRNKRVPVTVNGEETDEDPILVYDLAVGGDTVWGIRRQIHWKWLPFSNDKEANKSSWTGQDTLFVTWIGINDCAGMGRHDEAAKSVIVLQEPLYASGARNFLFIDVPPIERSPAVSAQSESAFVDVYKDWNTVLRAQVRSFAAAHPDATVLLFSSYDTFTRILDDPAAYGLGAKDAKKKGGSIWVDHLHPSSRVHDVLAKEIAEFLQTVSVGGGPGDVA